MQKKELGRYAYEERMPAGLYHLLNDYDKDNNITPRIVQALCRLIMADARDEEVYLCHFAVDHVCRIKGDGRHFCGYYNTQMLISYIRGAKAEGYEKFAGHLPSVLHLQYMIERAWDIGINEHGRVETGGIKGTRKHIGTQEVSTVAHWRFEESMHMPEVGYQHFMNQSDNQAAIYVHLRDNKADADFAGPSDIP